ncbi:molecular chaperone [Leuconostoc palmae]|uniref:molecular chaperone n=1 Tax=Leuconostoc palmae TaxID=501487 RepID=UPI001C7D78CF|nr:molecular chaperone [Leuconostoc palmae]
MRKAFIALGVLFIALLVALISFNQQPKYAGVAMPREDYQHVKQSKHDIQNFVQTLSKFDYTKNQTMTAIEKSADTIINHNSQNLSNVDSQSLRQAFYGSQGIVTIVQSAKKGHYNIDGSVASRFHDRFDTIIEMSVNAINKSSAQRDDIVTQMKKDLNIEADLYKIGIKNEE